MSIIILVCAMFAFFLLGVFVGRRHKTKVVGDLIFDHLGPGESIPYMAISEDIETIKQESLIALRVRHI